MAVELLWKGILLGIVNAAPVGPVGLLCLRKNLAPQRGLGLSAGSGMAAAYAIVAFCVLLGLKSVSRFLHDYETVFLVAGGAFLVLLGWRGLRAEPARDSVRGAGARYLGEFSASFAMTLFNPVPFASFAVILTAFPLIQGAPDIPTDLAFGASVAAGTLVFWLVVNEILHHVRKRSPETLSLHMAHGASAILLVLGIVLACRGIL